MGSDPVAVEQRPETCPWCSGSIGEEADVAIVRPVGPTSLASVLHRECASEWREFIERARRLAANGSRYPLVVAPMETSVQIEPSTDGA